MRSRNVRRASLTLVAAGLLLVVPLTTAWAAGFDSVSSVSPNRLPPGSNNANLVMNGSFLFSPTFSFSPATGITINTTTSGPGSSYTVNVSIAANAPTGARDVIVTDIGGNSTCSKCFTVSPPPTVSSVSPSSLAAGGDPVTYTITGTGFLPNATVLISNNASNAITVGTATVGGGGTTITVPLTAASTAVLGARDVTVMNDDNQSGKCSGCLTISPPPHAVAFFPAQRGAGLTGQVVDIVGAGFTHGTSIAFSGSGITLKSLSFLSSTNLRATIDIAGGAALGARDVTFTNSDNGGHGVCTGCFSITGPTSVAISTPSTINGAAVATFSQPVSGVSSSNSFVRFTGHTYNLNTTITCADPDGFPTSCSTGFVKTAALRPTSLITPGQHYTVYIAATGTPHITDFGGLTVAQASQDFRGGLFQQGEGAATRFTWRVVKTSSAFGGSYVVDHVAGASASYRFTGSSITWYTNIGPNYGIADLYVDGVLRATANSYSTSTHYRAAFTVSGFAYGRHTVTVRARGAKGSSHGTGTDVAVDAFRSGSSIIASPVLSYTWGVVKASSASAGGYSWSDVAGSTASFTFRGTQVEWDTVLGPQMGRAKVYIDGILRLSVDNYSGTTTYGVAKAFSGLSDAVHTLTIVVQGTHRSSSHGSFVAIDRWVVT